MSFNDLVDMYRTGELHITPEYQRTFCWLKTKQSRFIESIILEMPPGAMPTTVKRARTLFSALKRVLPPLILVIRHLSDTVMQQINRALKAALHLP